MSIGPPSIPPVLSNFEKFRKRAKRFRQQVQSGIKKIHSSSSSANLPDPFVKGEGGVGIFLALISLPLPVYPWRLASWILAYLLIWHSFISPRIKRHGVIVLLIATSAIFIFAKAPIAMAIMAEKSMTTEGILRPIHVGRNSPFNVVRFGKNGATVYMAGTEMNPDLPQFQLLRDSNFHLGSAGGGLLLTTTVKNRFGQTIVSIDNNKWNVNSDKAISFDKNFTDSELEVLDGGGNVVMQVVELPDLVQLEGEWADASGKLLRIADNHDKAKPGTVVIRDPVDTHVIQPIFVYPSKDHLGEHSKISYELFHKRKFGY